MTADSVLHVHSGDVAASMLTDVIPGRHLVYADVLWLGPVPLVWDASWGRSRAEALCRDGLVEEPREQVAERLQRQAQALVEAAQTSGKIVLWFDNCMYDQLLLQFVVGCLLPEPLTAEVWQVECPTHVGGFAELEAAYCAALLAQARRVDAETLRLSRLQIWPALMSETPEAIWRLAHSWTGDMRYPRLTAACWRLLEELPREHTGLSLLETRIVAAVLDGACELTGLYRRVSEQEEAPFFGEEYLRLALRRLASGEHPLLRIRGDIVTATVQAMRTLWGWGHWRKLYPKRFFVGNILLSGESEEWSFEHSRRCCVRRGSK